jgi:glycosyltransferase involved in cell wall biosynthesis
MTFNEEASVESTVRDLLAMIDRVAPDSEMLIVDDGSTDGSGQVVARLATEDPRIRVITHDGNRGLGGVYRTGFQEARGRFVTFFPADGQFAADIIDDFYPRVQNADIVLGYLPHRDASLISRALSGIERLLYRVLFGGFPRFQGILLFRRELLARYALRSAGRGWAVLMEFLLRCHRDGCVMVSVPTAVRPRQYGHSKVNNLRTIWSNLRQLFVLRRQLSHEMASRPRATLAA